MSIHRFSVGESVKNNEEMYEAMKGIQHLYAEALDVLGTGSGSGCASCPISITSFTFSSSSLNCCAKGESHIKLSNAPKVISSKETNRPSTDLNSLNRRPNTTEGPIYQLKATLRY